MTERTQCPVQKTSGQASTAMKLLVAASKRCSLQETRRFFRLASRKSSCSQELCGNIKSQLSPPPSSQLCWLPPPCPLSSLPSASQLQGAMPTWRHATLQSPLSHKRQHLFPSLLPALVQDLLSPQSIHLLKVGGGLRTSPRFLD